MLIFFVLSSYFLGCFCSVEKRQSEHSQNFHGKLLLTSLRIEDRLDQLEKKVSKIQRRYEKNEKEREETLEAFLNETFDAMDEMATNVSNIRQDVLGGLDERKKKVPVAFTVASPKLVEGTEWLTFTNKTLNKGNGFNETSGKFTCVIKGTYLFSFSFMLKLGTRTRSLSSGQSCTYELSKNEIPTGAAIYFENSWNQDYNLSNQVAIMLDTGDTIQIKNCFPSNPEEALSSRSSFSGVLLKKV